MKSDKKNSRSKQTVWVAVWRLRQRESEIFGAVFLLAWQPFKIYTIRALRNRWEFSESAFKILNFFLINSHRSRNSHRWFFHIPYMMDICVKVLTFYKKFISVSLIVNKLFYALVVIYHKNISLALKSLEKVSSMTKRVTVNTQNRFHMFFSSLKWNIDAIWTYKIIATMKD